MDSLKNKIQLLAEYSMVLHDCAAWTPDSYASTLLALSDDRISDFYAKDETEIQEIQDIVDYYYGKNVAPNQ